VSDNARLDAVVHGRVHGVGFRAHVIDAARDLGLTGWVANEPDRTVHCVAEGPQVALERLEATLRDGPRAARVDRVDVTWAAATGEFQRFDVRSGWHSGD
jgi:acylphosphatase